MRRDPFRKNNITDKIMKQLAKDLKIALKSIYTPRLIPQNTRNFFIG